MSESGMPTTYETTTTTTSSAIGFYPDYIRTIPGILKIVEIVLDLIVFICAVVWLPFAWLYGGGWVQFVSMGALITTLILGIMYITHIIYRVPSWYILVEFVYYCVFTVLYLIAAIVCAVRGAYHDSIAAAAFFAFAATAVYAVDTFLQFRHWRGSTAGSTTTTTTQQSTVTHSVTVEK